MSTQNNSEIEKIQLPKERYEKQKVRQVYNSSAIDDLFDCEEHNIDELINAVLEIKQWNEENSIQLGTQIETKFRIEKLEVEDYYNSTTNYYKGDVELIDYRDELEVEREKRIYNEKSKLYDDFEKKRLFEEQKLKEETEFKEIRRQNYLKLKKEFEG